MARSVTGTEAWRYLPCSYGGMEFHRTINAHTYIWGLAGNFLVNTWYEVSIICNDGYYRGDAIYVDGVERLDTDLSTDPATITSFSWRTTAPYETAVNLWLDGFRVRKYVAPEPTHGAWGAEETVE